ncbi:MAG: class I SAM-dependent methyltransferase, partial [Prochloraceae cyanobacterium]
MQNIKQKDYPIFSNLDEALEQNHTLKKMLSLIGDNQRAIDFGCATGYLAALLNRKGCSVVGVEINPTAAKEAEKHCQKVIVADLDFVSLTEIINCEEKFDVAIFGDVLEHLRNPWQILKETQNLLKPEGYVIASIPNIAHGAIRLALLQGKFEYTEIGILDNTHLRFFTRETVEDLFEKNGYLIEQITRTTVPIFSDAALIPNLNESDFDSALVKKIQQEEEADTLQFIIKAHPISSDRVFDISRQTKLELKSTTIKLQETQRKLEQNQTQLQQVEREYQQSQIQLQQAQQALAANQNQLEQAQQERQTTQTQLEQAQQERQTTQTQLEQAQQEWQTTQTQLEQAQQEWHTTQTQLAESKQEY